jgi:glycerol-3-phosphate dehydrogenase
MWERLGSKVDVLVIGGGINGAGIARDAARRGLKVALVEMRDLAWGTSSRSSKLVHGGLRYLEHLEFSLVLEAVSERRVLLDIAPHLVNPLGFLFPVFKSSRRPLQLINAGMWLYEGLSLFRSPKRHRTLSKKDVNIEEPALITEGLKGAPLYYDCSTDDARLTLESALDAAHVGAVVTTWAKVVDFVRDESGVRLTGAVIENTITKERKTVEANTIVNATGPWTDRTIAMSKAMETSLLRPTKGIHIVVDAEKLRVNNAVVCFHPDDGRVLFAIPWGDRTYLGTTDTDFKGDPALVAATLEDIDYLLNVSNHYFPDNILTREDVIATWAGLRPLISPQNPKKNKDVDESSVSREHQIIVGQDGLITIAGGKLTTYRRMSAEVVDTVVQMLRISNTLPRSLASSKTADELLPGAVGWPEDDDHARVAAQVQEMAPEHLSMETARLLANTYGMLGLQVARLVSQDASLARPLVEGRAEILAQVDWAVSQELAATVSDVMIRRTQIFYRDHDQGLGAAEIVAGRMATLIGWSAEETRANIEAYQAEVALSRQWRDEVKD